MSFSIEIKIRFRAAHRLVKGYKGKCNNIHGEAFTVIFIIGTKQLNEYDMVVDFGEVKNTLKLWIDDNLDHAYLYCKGDEIGKYLKNLKLRTYEFNNNATAEIIACELYKIATILIKDNKSIFIKKVGIIESFDDNIAWYEGD